MGFKRVSLGRTGLCVGRLGLGSSYGTTAAMVEEAFEHGVNYFYWGALRTRKMGQGLRHLARTHRDDMVIVVQCNTPLAGQLPGVVLRSLRELALDRFDVLLLGWRNHRPSQRLLEMAFELRERGYFRFLAVSAHHREIFPVFAREGLFDIMHVRYNAAHRGAEREVFPFLMTAGGPGVVSFTNTRWGGLINPRSMPPGETAPSAVDCYRFVLSHPGVHVAVCGPNSPAQLREDLATLTLGPLDEDGLERLRRIGDHVHATVPGFLDNLRGAMSIRL